MDFEMFEKVAQSVFSDAVNRCGEIPGLVGEIVNLQNDKGVVLLALTNCAHESRTLEIIRLIGTADNRLTGIISNLATSITEFRNAHSELQASIEASQADVISHLESIAASQPTGSEKKYVIAQTLVDIRLNIPIRALTLAAVLIQLYSVIRGYRDVHLVFLKRQPGVNSIKDVAIHLVKAVGEDVVHHIIPFLTTARAYYTDIIVRELDREIQSMSKAVNEFEQIFFLQRTLDGLVAFAESADHLVKSSRQDLVQDKLNFSALLDL